MKNFDEIFIIKNNGAKELFNADKIHQHLKLACEGLDVEPISIIKGARLKFYDGIKSSEIQESLIKSAQEMISEETPDYELAAGRLLNQKLRKEVYGQYNPKPFKECVKERIKKGIYTKDLEVYSDEELDYFGSLLKYDLDDGLPYSALNQMYSKYLIKEKGKCVETPQEVFILIPTAIFYNTDKDYRKKYIKIGYELLSQKKISLPTPIMNGARTTYKRFISCNLINFGDSVESIARGMEAILKCTSAKSGLGINTSFIRGLGAKVGNPSRLTHTGMLPIVKAIEASTGALTQIGRGGCHYKDTEVEVLNPNSSEISYIRKKIQDIRVGDLVRSFDKNSGKDIPKLVLKTFRPEVLEPYKVTFEDFGYIINSGEHAIFVNNDFKKTRDIKPGDIAQISDKTKIKVKLVERVEADKDLFYDIEVADTNCFYAGFNGLYLNHNSSNLTMPFYHYEIELFSQLGDTKGSHENRARHTDQTIIINKWFLEKALNKEDIWLFHMNEVGSKDPELDLYNNLGYYEKFDKLYQIYAKKVSNKHKKKINAWDLLSLIINERMITGRVYIVFADNFVNSSFKENLYFTNLCCLAGDTLIETDKGKIPLKDIKKGDKVLSFNQKNNKKEFKEVLNSVMTNQSAEVYELEYNGKKVRATADHRFLTKRGYIRVDELLESDTIIES